MKNWNWIDNTLLPFLLAVMRYCWLWPWLFLLRWFLAPEVRQPVLLPSLIVAIPVISATLTRLAAGTATPDDTSAAEITLSRPRTLRRPDEPGLGTGARLAVALAGGAAILLAIWWQLFQGQLPLWNFGWLATTGYTLIRIEQAESFALWLSLLALIYLWLRGALDGGKSLGHDDIWGAMVLGLIAIVVYLLIDTVNDLGLARNIAPLVGLFFAAGMAGLAVSGLKVTLGLDRVLGLGQRRASQLTGVNRYWLTSVGLTVGLLLGMGALTVWLVAPEQLAQIIAWVSGLLQPLWDLIGLLLIGVAYALGWLAYLVALLIGPLLRRLMQMVAQFAPIQPPGEQPEPEPLPEVTALEAVPDSYRWLALLVIAVIVLIAFALVLRRMRAARLMAMDETRESILSVDLLQDQLSKLLQSLLGRFRRAGEGLAFLSLSGEEATRRTIRSVYQQLLATTAAAGQPHQRSQTPQEYQAALEQAWSEKAARLAAITELYQEARYGGEVPSVEAAGEVERVWEEVQAELKGQEEKP